MIKRGDIYFIENTKLINGNQKAPDRPAVIVSNDMLNATSNVVELVYITTTPWCDLPTHVITRSMDEPSTVCCEQVYSISVSRLKWRAGELSREELAAVDAALAISLGIDYTATSGEVDVIDREVVKEVMREPTAEELDDMLRMRELARNMNVAVPAPEADDMLEKLARAETERDIYRRLYGELLEIVKSR